jgi:cobalamin-dependent methionine synthase I
MLAETAEPVLQEWLGRCRNEGLLTPRVAYGYFPCGRDGNGLVVFDPEGMAARLAELHARYPSRSFAAHALDLADRAAVDAFAAEIEGGGALGVLVHVAGTTYDQLAAIMEQDPAEALMQVNFWSRFYPLFHDSKYGRYV